MAKFKRGDKVVLYKMDRELPWYKQYLGKIGIVGRCGERITWVSFNGGLDANLLYTENLRPAAHGPCPMEAHESKAHGVYTLEEVE